MANLIINQAGRPAGVPGQSRSDGLRTGALVTLSHDVANPVFTSYVLLWAPEDDHTAAATFSTVGNTASFSPDPSSIGGTYRIKLSVTTASGTSESIRLFAIRTQNAGLRIPALNERADEAASLLFNGPDAIKASEFNEPSADGPFKDGNYGGWYSSFNELVSAVETIASAGTTGTWNELAHIDFSAMSTSSNFVMGKNTVNGFDFYVKGNPGMTGADFVKIVNGAGLRSSKAVRDATLGET
ncbi:MAG: hypothetical protein JWO15_3676, partial [Sphingomonadales bacterium]|nr:hypothetical protein [Sphingomonadales bacterium]